jgi:hypothetical protein
MPKIRIFSFPNLLPRQFLQREIIEIPGILLKSGRRIL